MEIAKLKDADNFVKISDGNKDYYGGNQAWFDFTVGKYGACGTVAAANVAAYLAIHKTCCRPLFNYSILQISKADFIAHMHEVYEYVPPIKLPLVGKNTPPFKIGKLAFGWTLGIWRLSLISHKFLKFARSRGVELTAIYCSGKCDKETITSFIREGLTNDNPILLLIGFNSKLKKCKIISPEGSWSHSCNRHWVTLTELREDEGSGRTMVKVSTWGGYAYLYLEDLMADKRFCRRLVYFTPDI